MAKEIGASVPAMSTEATNLLKRFLVYLPCERLQAEEALRSPYFHSLRDKVRCKHRVRRRVGGACGGPVGWEGGGKEISFSTRVHRKSCRWGMCVSADVDARARNIARTDGVAEPLQLRDVFQARGRCCASLYELDTWSPARHPSFTTPATFAAL